MAVIALTAFYLHCDETLIRSLQVILPNHIERWASFSYASLYRKPSSSSPKTSWCSSPFAAAKEFLQISTVGLQTKFSKQWQGEWAAYFLGKKHAILVYHVYMNPNHGNSFIIRLCFQKDCYYAPQWKHHHLLAIDLWFLTWKAFCTRQCSAPMIFEIFSCPEKLAFRSKFY